MDPKRYLNVEPTYADVGATRTGNLPPGYHHLRRRYVVGEAPALGRAADALLTWRVHAALGLRPRATAPRATPGAVVVNRLGIGPLALTAPCRIIWTVEEEDRAGFAYGTLPGHPESGEESFLLEVAPGGKLTLTVTAFTRPGRWYSRLGRPVMILAQNFFCGRYAAAVRRYAGGANAMEA
ncbi:DUF1990 domain-containing protein [Sphaerisporangium siamense]|uniref:Uncharacterized protein (UPF0548 family) n=1 Tax=Sphaerisporangium siamense TaxID=795645 RepID=A0A7W7DAL0_9ACTN|nr:DUF1990 domain-containing protein [Sphaerisporangium siamense]MBB4702081.1 uncharacterized protein (UPF0548 family) [Sphaerisporangium siamense]GII87228.1 DUF1990 domain-containing protein [Sphaerisporangium siamense]